MESVTFLNKKRKIKDMGELLAVAMSRGKCHWEKIRAVLASWLTASTSGCSSLACQHKRQEGPETQSLFLLSLWGCWTQGAVWGHIWDTVDCLDLDSTTVLGQYFLFAMALQTALTGSNMAWTKSEWDNDDYILFCLFFPVFFSYQCFNEKKGKPRQFLVPWHSCFSKLGIFLFPWLLLWCYFTVLKKGTKISIQREKKQQ